MLFKRISRASPEVVFLVAKNVAGATLTAGFNCVWDTGASADGVRVTQASTAALQAYAGVADADIANNDYGLLQVYGFRSSVRIFSSTGSSAAGDNLTVVNAQYGLTPAASGGTAKAFGFLCAAVAGSSSSQYLTNAAAFIRAL
jgi:hypothetical protein